jgi:hypothetical protein
MTVTFPPIFAFMALLPASTKPRRPGFAMSFPRAFNMSSRTVTTWAVASLTAISPVCKGSRRLTKQVVRTTLAGPHDSVRMTTLRGAEAMTIGAVVCTMSLTDAMGAPRIWTDLLLEGMVVLPVAPADWPVLTKIGAPSYLMFSVQKCKQVGHVAKHCDMLATAICLKRYMKHDMSPAIRDSIKKEWLERWKERLGHPTQTPHQDLRAYVEDLDITVAGLDDQMEWDNWEDDNVDTPQVE